MALIALIRGHDSYIAVIVDGGGVAVFDKSNLAHCYTCGAHLPELVITYQFGWHCVALLRSVQR